MHSTTGESRFLMTFSLSAVIVTALVLYETTTEYVFFRNNTAYYNLRPLVDVLLYSCAGFCLMFPDWRLYLPRHFAQPIQVGMLIGLIVLNNHSVSRVFDNNDMLEIAHDLLVVLGAILSVTLCLWIMYVFTKEHIAKAELTSVGYDPLVSWCARSFGSTLVAAMLIPTTTCYVLSYSTQSFWCAYYNVMNTDDFLRSVGGMIVGVVSSISLGIYAACSLGPRIGRVQRIPLYQLMMIAGINVVFFRAGATTFNIFDEYDQPDYYVFIMLVHLIVFCVYAFQITASSRAELKPIAFLPRHDNERRNRLDALFVTETIGHDQHKYLSDRVE